MIQRKDIIKRVIAIMAAVLIVGVIAAAVILNQPEIRLARGISLMKEEISAYSNPAADKISPLALQENIAKNPHTIKANMTMTFPKSKDVKMLNMSMEAGLDHTARQASVDFGLGAYLINLVKGAVTIDDHTVYVSAPGLLDDTYSLQLDDSVELWMREDAMDVKELTEALGADVEALKDAVNIQKAPDKVAVKTANRSMQCSGVKVTLPKEAMNAFLDAFEEKADIKDLLDGQAEDILNIRCMNDISLNLYFDSAGRIVRMMTPQAVECKDSNITGMELTADFTGTDRAMDVLEVVYKLHTTTGTKTYSISRNAAVSDEEYSEELALEIIGTDNVTALTARYHNTCKLATPAFDGSLELTYGGEKYRLSADGSFKDITEGEAFQLKLDTASFEAGDKALVRIAGTFGIGQGMKAVEIPTASVDMTQLDGRDACQMLYRIVTSLLAERYNWL